MNDPIELLKAILADEAVNAGWGMDHTHLDKIRGALAVMEMYESGTAQRLQQVEEALADFLLKTDRVYATAKDHRADVRKQALADAMKAMTALRQLMAPPAPAELGLSTEDRAVLVDLAKGLDGLISDDQQPLVKP